MAREKTHGRTLFLRFATAAAAVICIVVLSIFVLPSIINSGNILITGFSKNYSAAKEFAQSNGILFFEEDEGEIHVSRASEKSMIYSLSNGDESIVVTAKAASSTTEEIKNNSYADEEFYTIDAITIRIFTHMQGFYEARFLYNGYAYTIKGKTSDIESFKNYIEILVTSK
jgi:hypothetical protein